MPTLTTTPLPTTTTLNCYDNPTCSNYSLKIEDCSSKLTSDLCPNTCNCLKSSTSSTAQSTAPLTSTPVTTTTTLSTTTSTTTTTTRTTTTPSTTTTSSTTTPSTTITTQSNCYDNPTCASFDLTQQDCISKFTSDTCPNTCGCLNSTATTTAPDCTNFKCVYGVTQVDKAGSCLCVCNDKYYGPACDKLNITDIAASSDPAECNELQCLDEDIVALCPITCKSKENFKVFFCFINFIFQVCGGAIYCQNGGSVDPNNCQCNCPPGFAGANCENTI